MRRLFSVFLVLLLAFVPAQASLTFAGGTNTDVINHGSASGLDNLATWTALFWAKPTALGTDDFWLGLKVQGRINTGFGDGSIVSVGRSRATVSDGRDSVTGVLVVNVENFLAVTYDSGATPRFHIYRGDRTTAPAEVSYGFTQNGSGALVDDSASNLLVGNDGTRSFQGNMSKFMFCNSTFALGQIRQQWMRFVPVAGCQIYSEYGFNGTGTQPDWSGNLNTGAVTAATVGDHAPLPQPF